MSTPSNSATSPPSVTPIRASSAANLESKEIWGDDGFEASFADLTAAQLRNRISILVGNTKALKSEENSVVTQMKTQDARIKENEEKIKLYKVLPYLIGNVIEVRAGCAFCLQLVG